MSVLLLHIGGSSLLWGCNREPEGRFAREAEPVASENASPLKFAPTIETSVRPGETAVLLVEIASASGRRMDAVVGVHRGDAIAVEIWTFDQANAKDVLARVGEPEVLLRTTAAGESAPALQPLRLRMAAAEAQVHRSLGTPGETPQAAIEGLARAAAVVRDVGAPARDRIDALEQVFAGLDDGMIFERDAVGIAIDQLASGAWQVTAATAVSERRATVETRGGETLELVRKGDGWLIAAAK